jgi:hypothetical protein
VIPQFAAERRFLRVPSNAAHCMGDAPEHILIDFPSLKAEDVKAAVAFTAASVGEDLPVPATPQI